MRLINVHMHAHKEGRTAQSWHLKRREDSVRLGVGNVGDKTKRADEALGKNRAVWETVGSYFLTF